MIVSSHGMAGGGQKDVVFLRYAISKPLGGHAGQQRASRQKEFLGQQGFKPGTQPSALRINFGFVHGSA